MPAAVPQAQPEPQAEQAASAADEPAADESLPNVALSSDLLYKIMKAEIEFRDGRWQGPYVTMMALAQQTRDPRLARRAAEMALAAKQGGESMAAIRLWRELAPDSEEAAQYYLGFVILSDNLAEAEAIFQHRLQQATPATRGLAMFQIQQFLARAKDKPAAAAMLERLLAPYGDTAEAHVVLAQTAYARGDAALALKEAQAALAIKPGSEIAVLTLAQVTEDDAKVAEVLARFLAANPGAREVRAAHARVLVNQKQYDQARDEFLALLKGQPDNLGTLYALGIMSMQLGEPAKAEGYFSHFMEVLADHPDDERDPSKVLMILSQLAEERGDLKAALAWIDQVEQTDPKAYFGAQLRRGLLIGKQG
ncbi:MAG TPA: tetratricopeptide repeat protein, partial [Telluria sp.]|nr:tetratricopeptide repeat protein [Telluria sp.]